MCSTVCASVKACVTGRSELSLYGANSSCVSPVPFTMLRIVSLDGIDAATASAKTPEQKAALAQALATRADLIAKRRQAN